MPDVRLERVEYTLAALNRTRVRTNREQGLSFVNCHALLQQRVVKTVFYRPLLLRARSEAYEIAIFVTPTECCRTL